MCELKQVKLEPESRVKPLKGFVAYFNFVENRVEIGVVPEDCPVEWYFTDFDELVEEFEKDGYEVATAWGVTPCRKCLNHWCKHYPR